jgi:hypothetical protein
MIFFAKPVLTALPNLLRGVNPTVFLALICLGLGASTVTLLAELEKVRERRRKSARKRRLDAQQSRTASYRRPPDRER